MEAEAALATAADLQQRLGELEAATRVSGEDAARLKTLAKAGSTGRLGDASSTRRAAQHDGAARRSASGLEQ